MTRSYRDESEPSAPSAGDVHQQGASAATPAADAVQRGPSRPALVILVVSIVVVPLVGFLAVRSVWGPPDVPSEPLTFEDACWDEPMPDPVEETFERRFRDFVEFGPAEEIAVLAPYLHVCLAVAEILDRPHQRVSLETTATALDQVMVGEGGIPIDEWGLFDRNRVPEGWSFVVRGEHGTMMVGVITVASDGFLELSASMQESSDDDTSGSDR
jgi:hypothetical protein